MSRKKSDSLTKSKERVQKYGEVFTPERVVNGMLDMLIKEGNPDAFSPEKTFLEPACGTGNFLVEILRRKLKNSKNSYECLISLNSIYGVDIMPDNVAESKERMLNLFLMYCDDCYTDIARFILDRRIIVGDFLKDIGPALTSNTSVWDKEEDMSVIIGRYVFSHEN